MLTSNCKVLSFFEVGWIVAMNVPKICITWGKREERILIELETRGKGESYDYNVCMYNR